MSKDRNKNEWPEKVKNKVFFCYQIILRERGCLNKMATEPVELLSSSSTTINQQDEENQDNLEVLPSTVTMVNRQLSAPSLCSLSSSSSTSSCSSPLRPSSRSSHHKLNKSCSDIDFIGINDQDSVNFLNDDYLI